MNLEEVDKKRLEDIFRCGVDDSELREFFSANRKQLIMKGAKVQNLPHGNAARVLAIIKLPPDAAKVAKYWFSKNIKMIDPESVRDVIELLKLYENEEEKIKERDAKRLFRSCLVHLVSENPDPNIVEFLKSPIGGYSSDDLDLAGDIESGGENGNQQQPNISYSDLTDAIIDLLEGKDPEKNTSEIPSDLAGVLMAIYASSGGRVDQAASIIENLDVPNISEIESITTSVKALAHRVQERKVSARGAQAGIQIIQFELDEHIEFDFDFDQILGKCKKDYPETAVFVEPFAIIKANGRLVSLQDEDTRSAIFPLSGDVQARTGNIYPKQPKRGEVGVWHVQPNDSSGAFDRRNNFHLVGQKTAVYELCQVPFSSNNSESVREYIKFQLCENSRWYFEPLMFVLTDGLILGIPPGRDLTRDDGFDDGLPCWDDAEAFRFEGRILLYGPLPAHKIYECGTLASTLKKYFDSVSDGTDRLTKSQRKYLIEWINTGQGDLNNSRREQLLIELKADVYGEEAIDVILELAMKNNAVQDAIERNIEAVVAEHTQQKGRLVHEIETLEGRLKELKGSIDKKQKEQKALPASIKKAVKKAVGEAERDAVLALGNNLVFRALMGETGLSKNNNSNNGLSFGSIECRNASCDPGKLASVIAALRLSKKYTTALSVVQNIHSSTGLILILDGMSASVVSEAWARGNKSGCYIFEAPVGMVSNKWINDIDCEDGKAILLKDANLSPIDVYARPLLDKIQERILNSDKENAPLLLLTVSDSVAALPLPKFVESLSLRISVDEKNEFMREDEIDEIFDRATEGEESHICLDRLWNPAQSILLKTLQELPHTEAALALSILC